MYRSRYTIEKTVHLQVTRRRGKNCPQHFRCAKLFESRINFSRNNPTKRNTNHETKQVEIILRAFTRSCDKTHQKCPNSVISDHTVTLTRTKLTNAVIDFLSFYTRTETEIKDYINPRVITSAPI